MSSLETPLANDIDATDGKVKYDAQVKKVLSNKIILAGILKYTVKEFSDYAINDIANCIEGMPEVATVPVEAGLSNPESIDGMNTEDAVPNEGKITYDIKFYGNYSGRNTHLLRVHVGISKFGVFCALRRRRIFMAQNVTVHGSEQLHFMLFFRTVHVPRSSSM